VGFWNDQLSAETNVKKERYTYGLLVTPTCAKPLLAAALRFLSLVLASAVVGKQAYGKA